MTTKIHIMRIRPAWVGWVVRRLVSVRLTRLAVWVTLRAGFLEYLGIDGWRRVRTINERVDGSVSWD